ncbi:hypothetical protein ACH5RR_041026 [Cinchona calisaya]|uniref:Uncharacterized protein n=1 Tax=Cinchona calisaya TaxID=153742 RepID=A0ABD2XVM0_9GENT
MSQSSIVFISCLVGNLLKVDVSMATIGRQGKAKVCVDLDVTKHRLDRVWISNEDKGCWQMINDEEILEYCNHCLKMGHSNADCLIKNPKEINPNLQGPKHIEMAQSSSHAIAFVQPL